MKTGRYSGSLMSLLGWKQAPKPDAALSAPEPWAPPRIALALGGGFARGIAHVGVMKVLEANRIPVDVVTGVSAGAIAAAAYASGATPDEIGKSAVTMRFADVARWTICRTGFVGSERMTGFLKKLLKCYRFEEMRIPLGIVATDLSTGEPVHFRDTGDVILPIRASCSYPGLFRPVMHDGRMLVDGAMSVEIAAPLARTLGATRVISVHLPMQGPTAAPNNVFQVVNRCFQIMQSHAEHFWRKESDLVITPDVSGVQWDAFQSAAQLIEAGEKAALEALPHIREWITPPQQAAVAHRNGHAAAHPGKPLRA